MNELIIDLSKRKVRYRAVETDIDAPANRVRIRLKGIFGAVCRLDCLFCGRDRFLAEPTKARDGIWTFRLPRRLNEADGLLIAQLRVYDESGREIRFKRGLPLLFWEIRGGRLLPYAA